MSDPAALHPALDGLFPPSVAIEWADPARPGIALPKAEAVAVAKAVAKRRLEFANGRDCARRALQRLGLAGAVIPVGSDRAPQWPTGYVGTITHTRGFCAAAVARSRDHLSLGLDAEPDAPLPPAVVDEVFVPGELSLAVAATNLAGTDRVLFCAKEATYKLLYPLTRQFLDFKEVAVRLSSSRFFARLAVAAGHFPAGTEFVGHWRRSGGVLVAGAWLDS